MTGCSIRTTDLLTLVDPPQFLIDRYVYGVQCAVTGSSEYSLAEPMRWAGLPGQR